MSARDLPKTQQASRPALALLAVVALGMAGTVLLSRWIDAHRPAVSSTIEEEQLYITASAARQMSLGFRGLVADWYWMRSLQYVGDKILSVPQDTELDDLSQLNLQLLAPLLDTATTLDPEFLEPYEYAAIVLPAIDVEQAIRITEKGINANPTAWRLYQQLGYIYWQRRDFQSASEAYGRGALIPDAPPWMGAMKARMAAEGGSRTTAREIYSRMLEESADLKVKEMARRRLLQIASFEQRDVIRKVLSTFRDRTGHCPSSWKEIAALLRMGGLSTNDSGAPLDPAGAPYLLLSENCDVDLDQKSEVPYR
jgi:tetratricopeptide (TPR) repeat protein